MIDTIIRKAMNHERIFKLRIKAENYNVKKPLSFDYQNLLILFRMNANFALTV